ncbi:GNAT family N-acetyltransferase [Microbacterium panaciterrae]|uniref:GNAT family N-acetyltransferase n=1 Tax=Microbacterium panaciterrae TaxID=985759 RepID=A0ABP8P872_9MICO
MIAQVRRIRADEWIRVRDLRLHALQDPVAAIAFLDTFENASAQPDEFWQARAANAADGDTAAQFVAVAEDDEWCGTATVLGHRDATDSALVVGVFVAEQHRGEGAIEALFDECATWSAERGFTELVLEVHVDNARAQAAYERCGFVRTGQITEQENGREYVMARPLIPAAR